MGKLCARLHLQGTLGVCPGSGDECTNLRLCPVAQYMSVPKTLILGGAKVEGAWLGPGGIPGCQSHGGWGCPQQW